MDVVKCHELAERAIDIVRRVQAGQRFTITVAGRPAALIVPIAGRTWRTYADVATAFGGAADADRATDRDRLDDALRDPPVS